MGKIVSENWTAIVLLIALAYIAYERKPKVKHYKDISEEAMWRTFRLLKREIKFADSVEKIDALDHEIFEFGQMYQYNHAGVATLIIELTECLADREIKLKIEN